MSMKFALSLAVTGLVGLTAQSAFAVSVPGLPGPTLYLTDVSPTAPMTVTFPGRNPETTPYVGQINWSFDRSDPRNAGLAALVPGSTIGTFCIEGTQDVYIGQYSTFAHILTDISQAPQDNVGSHFTLGNNEAAAITRFWDVYYSQATLNNVNGAAFQLGIWELLYDTTPNLSAGNFKAAPTSAPDSIAAFNEAKTWLSNYSTITPTTHYTVYALSDPNLQDQLFDPPSVPLPAAWPAGLGLLGMLGLGHKLRRR